jgi:hypothetical protein
MRAALGVLLLLAAIPVRAGEPRFLPDDPLRRDPDTLPFPKPTPVELSTVYDVLEHTFQHRPRGPVPRALNANTLGEVPDSSWFTNRDTEALDVLRRGPGTGQGPEDGDWTIIGAKTQGITPGFTMRDGAGTVWFVKFDPPAHPHLSTSADVIVSRFFHAFGYHVPENVVVRFRPEQLKIAPDARVTVKRSRGRKRLITRADIDGILERVPHLADGRILAVASRRLEGQPLGPFEYQGTRGDDPNDVVPHEHRRELRGLRVFAAWLNHDDSRAPNSQDMFVAHGDAPGHVRHHLIDFSSSLGAGSDPERRIAPQNPRAGNEYIVEAGPILKAALTLGIWERPWRRVPYRVFREVGRIESDFFRPERWKPEYPNPAFERMRAEDAYWATKIVARFDDEAVRAFVRLGEYDEPEAERHLVDTLIARRDKTIAHWFRQLSPLDGFTVEGGELRFVHLGERHGLGRVEGYEATWSTFDNETGARTPLGAPRVVGAAAVPLPVSDAPWLVVRLQARATEPGWRKWVDVFVRQGGSPAVAGVEREE